MASASFKEYLTMFLLVGLFLYGMISFATGLADSYGIPASRMDTDEVNLSGIREGIGQLNEDSEKWTKSFTSDSVFVATGSLILFSVFGISKLVINSIINMANLIISSVSNLLGLPSIVTGTLMALLLVGLIFAGWRAIKLGE